MLLAGTFSTGLLLADAVADKVQSLRFVEGEAMTGVRERIKTVSAALAYAGRKLEAEVREAPETVQVKQNVRLAFAGRADCRPRFGG
jgi:hypothetical protein